jgi:hypothetical protein
MCGWRKKSQKKLKRERCRFRLDERLGARGDVLIYVLSRGSLTTGERERERERKKERESL